MKNLALLVLLICSLNSFGQKNQKIDSIYYLIDTAKVPANERMWRTKLEYPTFKTFTLLCPCLQYGREPSFIYDEKNPRSQIVTEREFKKLNLVNISTLILKAKQYTSADYKGKYAVFIIEPAGRRFICREVRLLRPTKQREPSIDMVIITQDSTAKKKP